MSKALYTAVQRFSIHDGGGIRTVVFLKGCPFTCPWCCNPENLSFSAEVQWRRNLCIGCSMQGSPCLENCPTSPGNCPTGAKANVGIPADVDGLLDTVLRDRVFYEESNGGITLSGGECLAGGNQAFAMEFLEACHAKGLGTAIESTLAVPLSDAERLMGCCDTFLVDFKIADRAHSVDLLRIDTRLRDDNLRILLTMEAKAIARMPIIPGYTDSIPNIADNVRTLLELGITRVDILPFHQLGSAKYAALGRSYEMEDVGQLSDADVRHAVDICEKAGLTAVIHGE